ncbi:type IV pilus biogenesis protein PilM [Aquincola sp. S2]|uniref:Type IV pilus biogenesis protein PilM n=1 Tax=Pseudaquabacterium terrae TaxID=2732868 RepID=A0ABX2EIL3_9BURK|nr:type IV pilus biogenesis protein PilM [Aquabacterium terrae]NRF68453.1 type IV pilus biogenesis protein PilM [Aquabacterium terrae]
MWPLVIVISMASAIGCLLLAGQGSREPAQQQVVGEDLALNMAVYRTLVVEYARAHPTFTGSVGHGVLPEPSWYRRSSTWKNQVRGDGTIVIYGAPAATAGLTTQIAELSSYSINAGEARVPSSGGTATLWTPRFGDTGLQLPGVPAGATVWIGRL